MLTAAMLLPDACAAAPSTSPALPTRREYLRRDSGAAPQGRASAAGGGNLRAFPLAEGDPPFKGALRDRPARLGPKRACPAARLPPSWAPFPLPRENPWQGRGGGWGGGDTALQPLIAFGPARKSGRSRTRGTDAEKARKRRRQDAGKAPKRRGKDAEETRKRRGKGSEKTRKRC